MNNKKLARTQWSSIVHFITWLLGALFLFIGCTSPRIDRELSDIPVGERFQPSNLYKVPALPDNFKRVAILPVYIPETIELDENELDSVVQAELRHTGRFEIVEVSPEQMYRIIGISRMSSLNSFPEDLLSYLASVLGADGVLQADLTSYRPYRPFEIGLRARLFDLRSNEALWAVDEVLNAGEKSVYTGSRYYSLGQVHNKYPFEDSYSALRSPNRFLAYSAFTLFETLPAYLPEPASAAN
ncbi:MAG: hypothetical protein KJT03_03480 [Verrucomicrobiae bacterium]|nr:hypothetical protein [Verrucomicrobiae bacterium]